MSPSLKSAQHGIALGEKRRSPAGGAKKKTSCRVARMRPPITSGNSLGSHGPRANTKKSAPMRSPEVELDFGQVVDALRRRPRALPISAAVANESLNQRVHCAPSHQCSEIRFKEPDADSVEIDHREEPHQFGAGRALPSEARAERGRRRCREIGLFARKEEEHAISDEDRQSGGRAQRLPLRQANRATSGCRSHPCHRRRGSSGIHLPRKRGYAQVPRRRSASTWCPCEAGGARSRRRKRPRR